MADRELEVIIKAKKLVSHTVRVSSNCRKYPKKFRFSVVDRMQKKSMDIYEALMEANRTDLKDFKRERSELQTRAITCCDELLFYIELSHELGFIDVSGMEYWSLMVTDIKRMAIAWRSKDKTR